VQWKFVLIITYCKVDTGSTCKFGVCPRCERERGKGRDPGGPARTRKGIVAAACLSGMQREGKSRSIFAWVRLRAEARGEGLNPGLWNVSTCATAVA